MVWYVFDVYVKDNTIRQVLSSGVIAVDYVRSKDNIAYPLAKGLTREIVEQALKGMGIKPMSEKGIVKENPTLLTGDPKI